MVLAHVLFVDIVGYSRELTPNQADLVEQLSGFAQRCPTFVRARNEKRVIAAPSGDGYALAFLDSVDDPLRCGEELLALITQAGNFRVRMATHFGPVEIVEDISGSPNVTGEGINMAARALDFTEPGALFLTERSYEIAREVPAYSDRLKLVGGETAKHGVPLTLYRLVAAPAHPPFTTQDLVRAEAIHAKATERKRTAIAPVAQIAERLAHIRRDVITGLILFAVVEVIHFGLESTDFGQRMRLWAYEKLQPNMATPEGHLPVVVADLQDNFNRELGDTSRTDMKRVAEFLSGIARHHEATGRGPIAIGIDIEFGARDNEVTFPDAEGDVIREVQRLAKIQPRPVPVFLAVKAGLHRSSDEWLGRPEFAQFAVHPLKPAEPRAGETMLYDTLHLAGEEVPSIGGQLALEYQKLHPRPAALPDFVADRYTEPLDSTVVVDGQQLKVLASRYYLNFGALDRLKQETLKIAGPEDADSPNVQDRMERAVVLVGRTTDETDQWPMPNSTQMEPGVYFHALGVYTQIKAPVSEFRPWLAMTLAFGASLFVLCLTSVVRRAFAWAAPDVDDHRLRVVFTLGLIALTLVGSVALMRSYGILWTDYILVAAAIAGDPILEGWSHNTGVKVYRWSRRIWRRFVFKGEAG